MFCPRCGSEYREGFTVCKDCDVALVAGSSAAPDSPGPERPDVELVLVYETADAALIPVVKSLLDDAEIQYMVKGESVQDFFGLGRFPAGRSYVVGPVGFFVREDEAEAARALLAALVESPPEGIEPEDE